MAVQWTLIGHSPCLEDRFSSSLVACCVFGFSFLLRLPGGSLEAATLSPQQCLVNLSFNSSLLPALFLGEFSRMSTILFKGPVAPIAVLPVLLLEVTW